MRDLSAAIGNINGPFQPAVRWWGLLHRQGQYHPRLHRQRRRLKPRLTVVNPHLGLQRGRAPASRPGQERVRGRPSASEPVGRWDVALDALGRRFHIYGPERSPGPDRPVTTSQAGSSPRQPENSLNATVARSSMQPMRRAPCHSIDLHRCARRAPPSSRCGHALPRAVEMRDLRTPLIGYDERFDRQIGV
jgi:hypothetical protein